MLNRRFLRIKVMQALYAFFQHEKANTALFEKDLYKSLDKIHELYLSILALLCDLHHVSLMVIDEKKNKRLPVEEDLNPNLKFARNKLLISIVENKELQSQLEKKKISWQNDFDLVRKMFIDLRNRFHQKQKGNDDDLRSLRRVCMVVQPESAKGGVVSSS